MKVNKQENNRSKKTHTLTNTLSVKQNHKHTHTDQ